MNEAHFKAVIAVLENQRNSAFNALVNTEAALTLTLQENKQLKESLDKAYLTNESTTPAGATT